MAYLFSVTWSLFLPRRRVSFIVWTSHLCTNLLHIFLWLPPSHLPSLTPLSCTLSLWDDHMLPAVAIQLALLLFSLVFVFGFLALLLFSVPWLDAIASNHLPRFLFPSCCCFSAAFPLKSVNMSYLLLYFWSQDKFTSCCHYSKTRLSGRFWLKFLFKEARRKAGLFTVLSKLQAV